MQVYTERIEEEVVVQQTLQLGAAASAPTGTVDNTVVEDIKLTKLDQLDDFCFDKNICCSN